VHALIAEQAQQRRERAIARRIKDACFRDLVTLADFDWDFHAQASNRTQIEELATAAFIGRQDNLVIVGQSGVGQSRIIQAVGHAACGVGYRVRYTTSADLLTDLTKRLADHGLLKRVRYYARFDWLILDEFAFDKIERSECPQAANLLYKIIDARSQRSTTVVTNVDFDAWDDYLGDPPRARAFLERVVAGALILKINGKSYRAHRAAVASDGSSAGAVVSDGSSAGAVVSDGSSAGAVVSDGWACNTSRSMARSPRTLLRICTLARLAASSSGLAKSRRK
jgi:DNA replication protein DnaC